MYNAHAFVYIHVGRAGNTGKVTKVEGWGRQSSVSTCTYSYEQINTDKARLEHVCMY